MDLLRDLMDIVGTEYVSTASEDIKPYLTDLSLVKEGYAQAVARPADAGEVSRIVKYCNENDLPVVPVSSSVHLYGASIPKQGGVIIDLSRMNKIYDIDLINRCVRFDAGVSWKQLTETLAGKGMRVIMPLAPRADRSAATDHLEREVTTNTVYDYGEPMQSVEVVFPNGDIFRTGSASVNSFPDSPARGGNPSGPGLDFYRLLQNAQGTMGIVTWMNLKIQSIPKLDKVYFAGVSDISRATDFLYRILPRRIGQECLILNNVNLAALLCDKKEEYEALREKLPEWNLILVTSGLVRRPEEKLEYEKNFIDEVVRNEFPDIKLETGIAGAAAADKKMLKILREPWDSEKPYWKNTVDEDYMDIFFIARPEKADMYISLVKSRVAEAGYDVNKLGIYVQPIEHNRACQMQFTLYYSKKSEKQCEFIDELAFDIAKLCHENGGYFTRPYGRLAEYLYDGAASYTSALKRVKNIFDPNNIMNPGNLCF